MKPVLQIDRLTVSYGHAGGVLLAVRADLAVGLVARSPTAAQTGAAMSSETSSTDTDRLIMKTSHI